MTKKQALELYNKISYDSRFQFIIDTVRVTNFIFWTDNENYELSLKRQVVLDYTAASTILLLPDSENIQLTLYCNLGTLLHLSPAESFNDFVNRKGIKAEFEEYL